jgi:peptidoglycan hydrolase|nr:MAG TPA: peptidoglycan hydrolase [Caudoviricetes sp.]
MGVQEALNWMDKHHRHKGNYPYSMVRRYGNPGYDCSSAVYYALIAGGVLPKNTPIGNTETLFKLKGKYLDEIYDYKNVRAGDIFIRGGEGTSAGAGGHTGMFYKKDGIIHSNYTNNGISYNDNGSRIDYFLARKRSPKERYFRPRYPGATSANATTKATGGYVSEFAKAVIAGKYGTGQDRVERIYKAVQDEVNKLVKGQKGRGNYVTAMAKDVIAGKYGNGADRKQRLYKVVQDEVNRLV